jgi:Protein of unknown function (DUF3618)
MDASRDGTAEGARVAQIRSDIVAARARVVETIDALEYKTDLPARLADVLGSTAAGIAARVLGRASSPATSGDAAST